MTIQLKKRGEAARIAFLVGAAIAALTPAFASETIDYSYDARGRLVRVSRSGAVNNGLSECYAYDAADNRVSVATGAGATCSGSPPPPPPPSLSFSINDVSVTEGGNLVFTITKSGTASGTTTVDYAAADGTATAGSDYTAPAPGTLTFLAADTSKTVSVSTIDDAAVEAAENLSLNLSNATGGAAITDAQGTGTINDNDAATPTCSGVTFTIAVNGTAVEGTSSTFTITKNGSASGSCSVGYATANGTAASPSDYTAKSGTLTFTSVQISQAVSVATIDDTAAETAETFSMSLSSPSGGSTLGSPSSATATINDNDSATACSGVSFAVSSDGAVTEGAASVFTVTRTGSPTVDCSVSYRTLDESAFAPSDYQSKSGTLTFTAGLSSQKISVTTFDDSTAENPEKVAMQLYSATSGGTIATSLVYGTINDNDAAATPPSFSINDVTLTEGSDFVFTVTKAGSNSTNVTFNYATANGTATSGLDYTPVSGTITFAPTDVTKTIGVHSTIDSNNSENDETFSVDLSGTGITFTDAQGIGTIIGNCSEPLGAATIESSGSDGQSVDSTTDSGGVVNATPTC